MGKMAEMQRKVLEVSLTLPPQTYHADPKTMMGPEAMGLQVVNLDWWDERVCRNYLFGTCPHLIFGNTVSRLVDTRPSSSNVAGSR